MMLGDSAAAGIATGEEDSRHGHALGEEGRTPAGTRSISAMSSSYLSTPMATYRIVARRVLVGPSGPRWWRRILTLTGIGASSRVTRIVSLTIGVVVGGMGGHLYLFGVGKEQKRGGKRETR